MDPQVLIAAADDDLRASLRDLLASHPLEVTAPRPLDLLARLARSPSVRVVILALGADAELDLLDAARERRPDVAVLVLSAHATVAQATEAMRRGAEDFLPIPYVGEILRKEVSRLLEAGEMRDSLEALHHLVADTFGFDRILSRSASMRPVFERALAASRNDTPVLVVGETGTGKELVARAIHANSRRASRPFVPVNCAALPRDLFESELFGHRRGAFSGAHADYPGLFVSAHGGTLFLDEVGELPPEAQPKLLRVLQDGEVRPVGGLDSRKVNTRIIAASNRTLGAMNRGGAMRQDLFFRLSVLVIEIPPLRERLDDLPLLVHATIGRLRARGVAVETIDAPAVDLLAQHSFPGNVRELENLIEGVAVTLAGGRTAIGVDDVRAWLRRRGPSDTANGVKEAGVLPIRLDELEAWAIVEAMRRTHGNKRQAAQLLGISRDTLYRKLEEAELQPVMPDSRTHSSNH